MSIDHCTEILKADVSSVSHSDSLMLETSAFRISVWWSIYIINSVGKTKQVVLKADIILKTSRWYFHNSFSREQVWNNVATYIQA